MVQVEVVATSDQLESSKMRTLISGTLTHQLVSQFPSRYFLFHFPPLSRENLNSLSFSRGKGLCYPKVLTTCSSAASDSLGYGGWDNPRLDGCSVKSGEFSQLRSLLNFLEIDNKRYIFVYLLGFVCALAISRVRVSSIVVFPACVIVFAVVLSIGYVNGGHVNDFSLIGTKKRVKDETFKVSIDKLRKLVDLFSGLYGKISNLKNDIRSGIERNHITLDDLESYLKVIESIGLSSSNGRNVVQACIDSLLVGDQELKRSLNQKSSRRKKEAGATGFHLLQFIGGLFQGKLVGSRANRMKDSVKRDSMDAEVNDQSRGNILAVTADEKLLSSIYNDNAGKGNAAFFGETSNTPDMVAREARRINVNIRHDRMKISDGGNSANRVLDNEQFSYRDNRLRFVNNQQSSMDMHRHNEVETWAEPDTFLGSVDFSVKLNHIETEGSFERERILHRTNGSYNHSHSREKIEKEFFSPRTREKERVMSDDDLSGTDKPSRQESDVNSIPSSTISDDIMFNKYLLEANARIKEARQCLRVSGDEGLAETMLYNSAKLLSKAIDMKPMSLLAVGQLGNTYLLHGEIKLKISRQLRAILANSDPISVQNCSKLLKGLEDQVNTKEKTASVLINVCEECEDLFVEAGRKYRLALSIDGNDLRALYNWGLALSFRAQLIADIGPEAAFDAEQLFLAAIDKFDAMMSKSNVYVPEALFRWGVALQHRSRLQPRSNKEKVKLLQQAKRLYEDALDMDANNLQVREALRSCISELDFRSY